MPRRAEVQMVLSEHRSGTNWEGVDACQSTVAADIVFLGVSTRGPAVLFVPFLSSSTNKHRHCRFQIVSDLSFILSSLNLMPRNRRELYRIQEAPVSNLARMRTAQTTVSCSTVSRFTVQDHPLSTFKCISGRELIYERNACALLVHQQKI
jgi:hypothetical protein